MSVDVNTSQSQTCRPLVVVLQDFAPGFDNIFVFRCLTTEAHEQNGDLFCHCVS